MYCFQRPKQHTATLIPLIFFLLIFFITGCSEKKEEIIFNKEELFSQALHESRIPVQPGVPGKYPFWNINATRFIYAPAFDFPELKRSDYYRFVIVSEVDSSVFSFSAGHPWLPLSPVWENLHTGYVTLVVEGVDTDSHITGIAGKRKFYRAAVFHGPYHKPVVSYTESARNGLDFLFHTSWLQHWLTDGTPDPSYGLYCYPSKMITAVINGMILYSEMVPANRKDALLIACNAADYLIGKSEPAASLLAYFPPTYDSLHIRPDIKYDEVDVPWARTMAVKNQGKIMLIYPAEVAEAYLNLYNKTKKKRYLDAACNIADTYARIQDDAGYWPLLVDTRTGKNPVANHANAGGILSLFLRLRNEYHHNSWGEVIRKASVLWEEKMKNLDFEGQFEDQKPSERYMNLANGPALEAARFYFDRVNEDSSNLAKAEKYLRFAEDQFVVWEKPIPEARPGYFTTNWFIFPCALEQYSCYSPIDAHAAAFISVFEKAWQITGKKIYLAKAISLANAMTIAQDKETGRYPTWWMKNRYDVPGWINCAVQDAAVMYNFGKTVSRIQIKY